MTTIGTMSFKGFNLHQLKNVINQEKNQEEKKNFVYFYSILKMLISIKKQNSNNVRIHTSDSTGKDLNEVNLHNTQEPSKINEHLLECISLTIKTKGLKKNHLWQNLFSFFFKQGYFTNWKNFRYINLKSNTFVRNGELFHEVTAFLKESLVKCNRKMK